MAKKPLDTNLIPPEKSKKVGTKVFAILESILRDKENLGKTGPSGEWIRNHQLVHGKHFRSQPLSKVPLVPVNLIKDHLVRTVNELTDNNPTFNVTKYGDIDEEGQKGFDLIQRIVDSWWTDTEQQDKLDTSVNNGETYGITVEKMVFDPEAEHNDGEARTIIVDPFHFGWWPLDLTDISELQTREALLFYELMSVRAARRKWPEFADKIKSDTEQYEDDIGAVRREINSGTPQPQSSYITRFAGSLKHVIGNLVGLGTEEDEEMVLIVECWAKDYTVDSEGNDKYKGNIRYIVCCNDGKNVLEDRDNPSVNENLPEEQAELTYLFDKFPFYGANSFKDTSNAWGESDIKQLERLNIELDKAISQIIFEKDRGVRRKFVNPKTSGVKNSELTNTVGILNPTSAEQAMGLKWIELPKLNLELEKVVEMMKELFFRAAGTFEMDQAKTGNSPLAYKAIAALLERAAVLKRGKIRGYSRLIRERGRMYVSTFQNFYTKKRFVSFKDQDGKDRTEPFIGSNLIIPARLSVVSGSTLPVSRVQLREETGTLFKLGVIDQEEALDRLDIAHKNDILQRKAKGLYGSLFDKLGALGMPPELIRLFQEVAQLDDKKFEQEAKSGQIPRIDTILMNLAQAMAGGEQPEDPEAELRQAELAVKTGQAVKLAAEKELIVEKIATERINQEVSLAGVKYDAEELKIRRAEVVSKIQGEIDAKAEEAKASTPGVYREKGLKSNNKKEAA
jgi:hypothetical protein